MRFVPADRVKHFGRQDEVAQPVLLHQFCDYSRTEGPPRQFGHGRSAPNQGAKMIEKLRSGAEPLRAARTLGEVNQISDEFRLRRRKENRVINVARPFRAEHIGLREIERFQDEDIEVDPVPQAFGEHFVTPEV